MHDRYKDCFPVGDAEVAVLMESVQRVDNFSKNKEIKYSTFTKQGT